MEQMAESGMVASFLVRLWLEPDGEGEMPALRGYIRHVQSKAERYFTDRQEMLAFLETHQPKETTRT